MKIEKINDNQIRCTLTREDLESRHLKLSELAYGSEKAKSLFREMIRNAYKQFGFDAEDIPLMIEAVPISADAIILIVTKVSYPEELDTRFSNFTGETDSEEDDDDEDEDDDYMFNNDNSNEAPMITSVGSADEIITDSLAQDSDSSTKNQTISEDGVPVPETTKTSKIKKNISRCFLFHSLDDVIHISHLLQGFYYGDNALYKENEHHYHLFLHMDSHTPIEFNKICNILSEYGISEDISATSALYINEHAEIILAKQALQTLSNLN